MNARHHNSEVRPTPDAGDQDRPAEYRIIVRGHLDESWSDWLDGLEIARQADGTSLLTGAVADQSALYGLLIKMRDLNLVLLAVRRS